LPKNDPICVSHIAGQQQIKDEPNIGSAQWAVMLSPSVDPKGFALQFGLELAAFVPSLHLHLFLYNQVNDNKIATEHRRGTLNQDNSFVELVGTVMKAQPTCIDDAIAKRQLLPEPNSKKRHTISIEDVLWVQQQIPLQRAKRDVAFTDPLFREQWHLQPASGNTVSTDVIGAWEQNATGSGVTIAICDDGIQSTHPDLVDNFRFDGSWNFNFNNNQSGPSNLQTDGHGTSCASAAAGRDDGRSCGVGVAFRASLSAIAILQNGPLLQTDALEAAALSYRMDINDIYSNSWGPIDDGNRKEAPGPLTAAAMTKAIKEGRKGLGTIYMWAAGNGASRPDNCNYDGYANQRLTITIGAVDSRGVKASYSEPCAALIAVTPGGGVSGSPHIFINTASLLPAAECNRYFSGTSAACPLAAGIVALILEVNPNLNWIDVQQVIIDSTTQNQPTDTEWVRNGAGRWVSHKYGFGLLSATRAVETARKFTDYADLNEETANAKYSAQPITITAASRAESNLTITTPFAVRHVELYMTAKSSTGIGNLAVTLTSPSGTESVLAESHPDSAKEYTRWRFTTLRCWGESSAGIWTLRVSSASEDTQGELTSWEIIVYGGPRLPYSAFLNSS
jgi:proprotein convertase subtilisin/kexin type 7